MAGKRIYPRPRTRTVYVRAEHEKLWALAETVAADTGKSVSELIADGLALALDCPHGKPADGQPPDKLTTLRRIAADLSGIVNRLAAVE